MAQGPEPQAVVSCSRCGRIQVAVKRLRLVLHDSGVTCSVACPRCEEPVDMDLDERRLYLLTSAGASVVVAQPTRQAASSQDRRGEGAGERPSPATGQRGIAGSDAPK